MAALQPNISKVCLFKNDFGKMWSSKDLQKLRPFAQLQIDRTVFANGMITFFQVRSLKLTRALNTYFDDWAAQLILILFNIIYN